MAIFVILVVGIGVGIFLWMRKSGGENFENLFFDTEISTNATININKKNYECEFCNSPNNTRLIIKKPESIKGLKMEWKDGKREVSFANLKKQFVNFDSNSFLEILIKILNSINNINLSKINEKGDNQTFLGNIDNIEFELTSENSKILEIYVKSTDARIIFD